MAFYSYFPSRSDLVHAQVEELNEILHRIESPRHGSTARELVTVAREGTRKGIAAWLRARAEQWDTIRPYTTAAFEAAAIRSRAARAGRPVDRRGRRRHRPATGSRGAGRSTSTRCSTSSPTPGST